MKISNVSKRLHERGWCRLSDVPHSVNSDEEMTTVQQTENVSTNFIERGDAEASTKSNSSGLRTGAF
jgi:hypothetical protein